MRPHIRRWRARYRVAGDGAGDALARVESGARSHVAAAYEDALDRAFGDDPAVYVVRRVRMELVVSNPSVADEAAIARRWADRTCASIVKTVMRDGDDANAVMRFDDTADFIARFLADLLDGLAWERWYYGAFSEYESLALDEAIRRVLLDNREHLAAILRRLTALGRWRAMLARMPREAARELWHAAAGEEPHQRDAEPFRVFVRAAMRIADALALGTIAERDEQALLVAYGETSPAYVDWRETRALAEAVLAVLMFFARRGIVTIGARDRTARLGELLAEFDWLDRAWLAAAIDAWLREERERAAVELPAAARPPMLTALQRRVLDVIERLLARGALALPDAEFASERNALALFAALAAAEPALAVHPAVPGVISWFLRSEQRAALTSASESKSRAAAGSARELVTRFGGVALLTRVLLEARVTQLAEALGAVPLHAVLLALAAEWSGDSDFDEGLRFWSGFDGDAQTARDDIARLPAASCAALRDAVQRLMSDRSAFAPSLAPLDDSERAPLATVAWELARLWAHWLPGIHQSGVPWLLRQFVPRRGVLRVDGNTIAVTLAPAPLDVVLDMAGYFRPIAAVPWLGDRRMTFVIDRSLA